MRAWAKDLGAAALRFVGDRKFDLLGLLVLALVLVGVSLWNQHWTTALFAGVLASFALALVRLRQDVETLGSGKAGIASVFLHETPPDVISSFAEATQLLLIGVSLDRALRDAYIPLETFLNRHGALRVLLVDPESETTVRIADRRAYQEHGYERRKQHIESSIETFRELRESTGGNVELRVTDDPLTFGATMIDGTRNTHETRIIIQHYSFKKRTAKEPNPVFVVRPGDQEWFAEFKEELENLWDAGTRLP